MPFPDLAPASPAIRDLLAPGGLLRAGINLSNFLLVSSRTPDGGPAGVSPDMARALADHLGVGLRYVTYESPGLLADAAPQDEWDVGLIGAEPQRAELISFTPAYTEIEATYLVPASSPITSLDQVDVPGNRIAVTGRAAYGLWLERNIKQAKLVRSATLDDSVRDFVSGQLEVLAGLRPKLITDQAGIPGSRILDGRFMAVQQAIGTPRAKAAATAYLCAFVEAARSSGFVAELIHKHGVQGLSVA